MHDGVGVVERGVQAAEEAGGVVGVPMHRWGPVYLNGERCVAAEGGPVDLRLHGGFVSVPHALPRLPSHSPTRLA